jgi:hypothetical protein
MFKMKKNYLAPETEIVEIIEDACLLQSSNEDAFNGGGMNTGGWADDDEDNP